ncbi:MAG: 2-hydroxyacid dehydrogenase [Propionibacteriaceae bacterium]|jgi:phosphoglycerate dehydrogenase-like enzyme|nr:2-hydroxyacid dehydrogenase [Propionibacteriaceae bacterium]
MRVWLPYDSVEEARRRLGPLPSNLEIGTLTNNLFPPTGEDEVELLAFPNYAVKEMLDQAETTSMPKLKWVQLASAGYEYIIDDVPLHIGLCNAAGVHDAGTAELAVGLALTALRGIDTYAVDRLSSSFRPWYGDSLADKRILIVGYGHIGSAIERRLAGFEVASVTRVARTAKTDPQVYSIDLLPELVGQADVIFLALPGSPETHHIVDADLLARMADRTLVVNVGRGILLDTDALLAENGRIRAGVDVTDPEPLPPDHPLWKADFVSWTPHVGGQCTAFEPRYDALIREQVTRLATGLPMLNVVRSPQ